MTNKKPQLFKILGILLALSILLARSTAVAMAASYPSNPVRLIVAVAPGGATDIVGRLLAAKLTERLGKPVIVENRPGAGGVVGTEVVAKSQPDGYTLLIQSAAFGFYPVLYKLPFDTVKDFAPVARLASGPISLVVHPSVPANTVKELIALAKQKPGQLLAAAAGVGTFAHMGTELFKIKAGIDFQVVQFKGGGPAMIDLLGGHSNFALGSLIQTLPHIKSGKFRVLGTGGLKRSVVLPDVPTIAEAGVPGYEANNWWGILALAGTPAPIVERLSNELKAILASDEIKKQFLAEGGEVDYLGPTEFRTFLEAELTTWTRVVETANIKLMMMR